MKQGLAEMVPSTKRLFCDSNNKAPSALITNRAGCLFLPNSLRNASLGIVSTTSTTTTKVKPHWWSPEPVVSRLARDSEQYLEDRLQYKINSYTRKGRNFRLMYWGMASFAAIGSAVVPALINLEDVNQWIPTVISLVVAAFVALEGIFHPRELWRNYDLIAAALREEEMRYSTQTTPYEEEVKDGVDRFHRLVQRVEDRIKEERLDTIALRTAPTEENG